MNRLTAADYDDGTFFHYAYDEVGNRLTQETLSGTNTYAYDIANRLTSVDGVSYTWDNNGNLLTDGVSTYAYNYANMMASVNQIGVIYTYNYSGLGDRLQQTVDGVPINYTLDINTGLTQVLADETNTYLYGQGRIAQEGSSTEYFLGDALASVRQLADSRTSVTLTQSYEPYGNILASSGDGESDFQYTGEARDSYIKLVYLRSRYMSTDTGRFTTKDVWDGDFYKPMSYNDWLYVSANPINHTDPRGLYLCENFDCDGDDDFKWQGELKKQDKLFSLVFKGLGLNGAWTRSDWEYYCENRDYLYFKPSKWKRNTDNEIGWDLFALHAERLASHYSLNEKNQFVRDFALLFGGIPSKGYWFTQAIASYGGPPVRMPGPDEPRSYVHYKNTGLPKKYLSNNQAENQSHHYAGLFYLGYFAGPGAGMFTGFIRDVLLGYDPGDMRLGDQASVDGFNFWFNSADLQKISDYIMRISD